MSVDYKLIGSRIRERRKSQKKTQEMLAEALSVSVGYVSQIERGVTKVSLDTLSNICFFLSCDLSQLLSGANPQQQAYLNAELEEASKKLNDQQKKFLLAFIDLLSNNS